MEEGCIQNVSNSMERCASTDEDDDNTNTNNSNSYDITNIKYYCDLTNYPDIYECSYWGQFIFDDSYSHDHININIIENRNKFIKEYNIAKYNSKNNKYIKLQTDMNRLKDEPLPSGGFENNIWVHTEHYLTHDKKRIMVISPYIDIDSPENISEFEEYFNKHNFKPYNKLYSIDTLTFIRVF